MSMGGNAVIYASFLALAAAMWGMCQQLRQRLEPMTDDDQEQIARLQSRVEQQRMNLIELGEIVERDLAQAEALSHAYDRAQAQLEAYRRLKFPTMLRKMWTGAEVAEWLAHEHERIGARH